MKKETWSIQFVSGLVVRQFINNEELAKIIHTYKVTGYKKIIIE
ncbi:MAG: hypothetical protein VZR09_10225 [Candidatus Gastranaerophilaceae bacterium]|nr:hypothetical protein [Candidatus Gastranaerophilaceae bacterium]